MMRRLSTVFKNKDKENTKSSPTSAENGATSSSAPGAVRRLALGVTKKSTSGTASSNPQAFEGPDHSVKRAGIVGTLESLGKVISTANRPLNTENGDGSYETKQEQTGLWDDLKALRIKDLETLEMTIKQELGTSKLADDKTMLMEKLIQVSLGLHLCIRKLITKSWLQTFLEPLKLESNLLKYSLMDYGALWTTRQLRCSVTSTIIDKLMAREYTMQILRHIS